MEQHDKFGVTLQIDWKFTFHVQLKLCEANNCIYDPFKALVLLNINYALPVYGANMADLNIIQCFLRQYFKRYYILESVDISTKY